MTKTFQAISSISKHSLPSYRIKTSTTKLGPLKNNLKTVYTIFQESRAAIELKMATQTF